MHYMRRERSVGERVEIGKGKGIAEVGVDGTNRKEVKGNCVRGTVLQDIFSHVLTVRIA